LAQRRFGGIARLFGEQGLAQLAAAHVVVVGVGGVGSWAAEALARSGLGRLTLIDMDHVAESNVNRQVHALQSTLGAAKVAAMAERIRDISAACDVRVVDDFVTLDNVEQVVPPEADAVIDAIDSPRAKAALIAACVRRGQPIAVSGAAGGRTDPLALRSADLALTSGDALLASVRSRLRRDHGFSRESGAPFGVSAIFAPAPAVARASPHEAASRGPAGAPLACAGYGSIVTVTASMGLAAAAWAIGVLTARAAATAGVDASARVDAARAMPRGDRR
jgi:tRNA A37 threonylcarbamoyladenosine dehydratase